MRIAIGSDHAGVALKAHIVQALDELAVTHHDFGVFDGASTDYPDRARDVAGAVASGRFELGIIICGTGVGVSIAANKIRGIRAALCHDTFSAKMSREHNNANILCLGARIIGPDLAAEIVRAWLTTTFSADARHARRVGKITHMENGC